MKSNPCGFQTVGKMPFIKPANFLEGILLHKPEDLTFCNANIASTSKFVSFSQ